MENFVLKGTPLDSQDLNYFRQVALQTVSTCLKDILSSRFYPEIAQELVNSMSSKGQGLADLVPYLEKYEAIDNALAKNIASNLTRRIYAELNHLKYKNLGISSYEWVYAGTGEGVCALEHQKLNGNTYKFDESPIIDISNNLRGKPGDIIGCYCTSRPVIAFE